MIVTAVWGCGVGCGWIRYCGLLNSCDLLVCYGVVCPLVLVCVGVCGWLGAVCLHVCLLLQALGLLSGFWFGWFGCGL